MLFGVARFVALLSMALIIARTAELSNCCLPDLEDRPTELLACVSDALPSYSEVLQRVGGEKGTARTAASFIFHQFMTSNLYDYGSYTYACGAFYCAEHDYDLLLFKENDLEALHDTKHPHSLPFGDLHDTSRDRRWTKVWLLHQTVLRLLDRGCGNDGYTDDHDCFVVWMDSDVVIVDMSLKLEMFTMSFSYAHMFASREFNREHGAINSGFMLMRVSHWTKMLLEKWWGVGDRSHLSDQHAFDLLVLDPDVQPDVAAGYIIYLESEVLNSKFPTWYEFQAHHQVLHLAGAHDLLRKSMFSTAYSNICSNAISATDGDGAGIENSQQLQLGLSAANQKQILQRQRKELVESCLALIGECESLPFSDSCDTEKLHSISLNTQVALQMGFAGRDFEQSLGRMQVHDRTDEILHEFESIRYILTWLSTSWKKSYQSSTSTIPSTQPIYFLQMTFDAHIQLLEHLKEAPMYAYKNVEAASSLAGSIHDRKKTLVQFWESLAAAEEVRSSLDDLVRRVFSGYPETLALKLQSLEYYKFKMYDFQACGAALEKDTPRQLQALRMALAALHPLLESTAAASEGLDVREEAVGVMTSIARLLCSERRGWASVASHDADADADADVTDGKDEARTYARQALLLLRKIWGGRVMPELTRQLMGHIMDVEKSC